MARLRRFLLVVTMVALTATTPSAASATISAPALLTDAASTDKIQPWLTDQLTRSRNGDVMTVQVHADSVRAARAAVARSGMTALRDMPRIGVTIARGTVAELALLASQPAVTYIEGNRPIEFHLSSSHEATRSDEAVGLLARYGRAVDGTGVSVAVIDTGVDPTHPFFAGPDGQSVVVANLKNVCGIVFSHPDNCFADVGPLVDTDTTAASGHGTHVNGIVAGQPVVLADGERMRGAAPGARLVSLSVGAGVAIINANMALEWVLLHHRAPCGDGVEQDACPPIKVVNNSYGPAGGGEFDPRSATTKLQRSLAAEGVVTVWSNGNGSGDGSRNQSNPAGQDPTPGVISVASYFDGNSGTRDGTVSSFSSRGDRERPGTWPDISAPGERITSACRPYLLICSSGDDARSGTGPAEAGAYNTISGTSMAAPHISGTVAQLFQADPQATPADVEHALKSTAYRFTDGANYQSAAGYVSSYDKGAGLVDVASAVVAMPGWSTQEVVPVAPPGDAPTCAAPTSLDSAPGRRQVR